MIWLMIIVDIVGRSFSINLSLRLTDITLLICFGARACWHHNTISADIRIWCCYEVDRMLIGYYIVWYDRKRDTGCSANTVTTQVLLSEMIRQQQTTAALPPLEGIGGLDKSILYERNTIVIIVASASLVPWDDNQPPDIWWVVMVKVNVRGGLLYYYRSLTSMKNKESPEHIK